MQEMQLTKIQQKHVDSTPPAFRAEMAGYLADCVDVVIHLQDAVPDVGRFAVAVRDSGFWVDCCVTKEDAALLATQLGLRVVS